MLQTVQRAVLMASIAIAENVNTSGLCEDGVGAQYLLASIERPTRLSRRMNGILAHHPVARDMHLHCTILVTCRTGTLVSSQF